MDYNITSNDVVFVGNVMMRVFLAPHRQSTDFPTYASINTISKIQYFDKSWTKIYINGEENPFYVNYKLDNFLSLISSQ